MDPSQILEGLLDKKTLAVLRTLSQNPERQFYLREIAKTSRVPVATVFRLMKKLVVLEIVDIIQIKRMKLYQYGQGKASKFVEQLIEVRRGAVEEFVERCRLITEIRQVILHGRKQKDRANFLVIGEQVPSQPLVEAQAAVREQLGFTCIYLVLGPQQYEQMVEMGLYAGDRQVLLQK